MSGRAAVRKVNWKAVYLVAGRGRPSAKDRDTPRPLPLTPAPQLAAARLGPDSKHESAFAGARYTGIYKLASNSLSATALSRRVLLQPRACSIGVDLALPCPTRRKLCQLLPFCASSFTLLINPHPFPSSSVIVSF